MRIFERTGGNIAFTVEGNLVYRGTGGSIAYTISGNTIYEGTGGNIAYKIDGNTIYRGLGNDIAYKVSGDIIYQGLGGSIAYRIDTSPVRKSDTHSRSCEMPYVDSSSDDTYRGSDSSWLKSIDDDDDDGWGIKKNRDIMAGWVDDLADAINSGWSPHYDPPSSSRTYTLPQQTYTPPPKPTYTSSDIQGRWESDDGQLVFKFNGETAMWGDKGKLHTMGAFCVEGDRLVLFFEMEPGGFGIEHTIKLTGDTLTLTVIEDGTTSVLRRVEEKKSSIEDMRATIYKQIN